MNSYYIMYTFDYYTTHFNKCMYYLVNYNNSLTWIKATDLPFGRPKGRIKAIWGWFPLLTMIPARSQWGRYNLINLARRIYIYTCTHPCQGHTMGHLSYIETTDAPICHPCFQGAWSAWQNARGACRGSNSPWISPAARWARFVPPWYVWGTNW